MKRALRVDKMTLAALEAVLRLYRDPERLAGELPTLRLLTRPQAEIEALARALRRAVASARRRDVRGRGDRLREPDRQRRAADRRRCRAPGSRLRPRERGGGRALDALAAAFRALPIPVIGRIEDGAFVLDLRCLDDERGFVAQLGALAALRGRARMIVGTAGHIDHGKTTLVNALTGVDTDRLPGREGARHLDRSRLCLLAAPDGDVLGFVDVPGHERFVHNMLAGAPASTSRCWSWRPTTASCRRRASTSPSSICSESRGARRDHQVDRVPAARVAQVEREIRAR